MEPARRRGLLIGAIVVVAALVIGGIVGAALRGTKTTVRTNTVTVTSIVTQPRASVACADLLGELHQFLVVITDQAKVLANGPVGWNPTTDIATNALKQQTDVLRVITAIGDAEKGMTDIATCRADTTG